MICVPSPLSWSYDHHVIILFSDQMLSTSWWTFACMMLTCGIICPWRCSRWESCDCSGIQLAVGTCTRSWTKGSDKQNRKQKSFAAFNLALSSSGLSCPTMVMNFSLTPLLPSQTVAPSCLAYLDNGVVFIGSVLGDSQLVKVRVHQGGQSSGWRSGFTVVVAGFWEVQFVRQTYVTLSV